MRRILYTLLCVLFAAPAVAQQWDQVNGSMQVKSGPSTPLVIVDQTNAAANSKILSLRAAGTEKCSIDIDGDLVCAGSMTFVNETFTGQMIGPLDTDCSAPAYSGLGKLTTGFAVRTAPSAAICVGGSLVSLTTATGTVITGLLSTTTTAAIGTQLAVNAAINTNALVYVGGAFTGASNGRGFRIEPTLTIPADGTGDGILLNPTFVEAGSGNHALLAGLNLTAPIVTVGAATVTDAATAYVSAAPTVTVSGASYALWVDAGTTRLDGDVNLGAVLLVVFPVILAAVFLVFGIPLRPVDRVLFLSLCFLGLHMSPS